MSILVYPPNGKTIRRTAVMLCLVLLACGGGWQAAADEEQAPSAPLFKPFLDRLANCVGYQAEFVQTNHWAVFDETDHARGRLSIAPPRRFRFDYEEPAGHLVGCDGDFVWTIIPEEKQVLRAGVHHTTGLGELFWEGLGTRADSLATFEADSCGRRLARIGLAPRPEWGVRDLQVWMDVQTKEPAAYGYLDEEGNEVRFEFVSWDLLTTIPDSLFRFRRPENYELIDVD